MGTETENTAAQSTTETPSDSGAGNSNAGANNGGQQQAQAEPNWLPDRLKRAEEAARKKLLEELGITDPEADKQMLADARKRKQDEMTAVEKAAAEKEAAEKKAAELETTLNAERAAYRLERRDNAIRDALRSAGVQDDEKNPHITRLLVLLKGERAAEVDALQAEDGTIDAKKLSALVETAKASYAEYFKPQRGGFGTPSHRNGQVSNAPSKDAKAIAQAKTAQRIRGN